MPLYHFQGNTHYLYLMEKMFTGNIDIIIMCSLAPQFFVSCEELVAVFSTIAKIPIVSLIPEENETSKHNNIFFKKSLFC